MNKKPRLSIKQQREDLQKQAQEIADQAKEISDAIFGKDPIDEVHDNEEIIISKL